MKEVIIIGGGIAGLTAGIYAEMNGYKSKILEKHIICGGECTGWDRKGYHIDGCIHWLTGTKEGTSLNRVWKEVGALDGVEVIQFDYFNTYECNGESLVIWKDIERFRSDLLKLSLQDKKNINSLIKTIKRAMKMDMPVLKPFDIYSAFDFIKLGLTMAGPGLIMAKYGKVTCEEYGKRFKHPILRSMFKDMMRDSYSMSSLIFSLATFMSGNGGIPRGGSRAMAKHMEDRYRQLGGEVILNKEADEIIIKDNKAVKVVCKDGSEYEGDYIIPACDAHITFERLLKGKYNDPGFVLRDSNPLDYPLPSCVYIAYGIEDTLDGMPHNVSFECEPYTAGATEFIRAGIKVYSHEPNFAPKGANIMISYIDQSSDDCEYWLKLRGNRAAYKAEKDRLGKEIMKRIEQRFIELKGKLILLDVATPATFHRYCGAYKGAWMAWMTTPKSRQFIHNGRIKGIDNIMMASQWLLAPGGLPTAVATGKFAVQRIVKQDDKEFIGVQ